MRWGLVVAAAVLVACQGDQPRDPAPPGRQLSNEERARDIDSMRIVLVEGLAAVWRTSRETAEGAAADSYYWGTDDTCTELLGDASIRCDEIRASFNEQRYPGDPGYIPDRVEREIRQSDLWTALSRMHEAVCADELWPYGGAQPDPLVRETCRSYPTGLGTALEAVP